MIRIILAFLALSAPALAAPDLAICEGKYALCAASTCKPVPGKFITVNGQQFPQLDCDCPVLKGPSIADLSLMNGSCAAQPGRVWSLFSARPVYPQASNNWKPAKAVHQECPASLNQGNQFANCWSFSCDIDPSTGRATCHCPQGESPWTGKAVPAATAFVTDAGQGNQAYCNMHPVGGPVP